MALPFLAERPAGRAERASLRSPELTRRACTGKNASATIVAAWKRSAGISDRKMLDKNMSAVEFHLSFFCLQYFCQGIKLDKEEAELLRSIENDEWESVPDREEEIARHRRYAANTTKNRRNKKLWLKMKLLGKGVRRPSSKFPISFCHVSASYWPKRPFDLWRN